MQKANELAAQKITAEPERFAKMGASAALAAARSEVWKERPDLAERQSPEPERSTVTTKFTKADAQDAATELAKKKIERQPERFGKIHDPAARLAAARTEIYREYPELVALDREAH